MKYSKNFERDWLFYIKNRNVFTFCGTAEWDLTFIIKQDSNGKDAKECFHLMESQGRKSFPDFVLNKHTGKPQYIVKTKHPLLLERIFLVKSSINFNIKQWAEGYKDGTFPLIELSKRKLIERHNYNLSNEESREDYKRFVCSHYTLSWGKRNGEIKPVKYRDVQKQYNMPDWVIDAVISQAYS